MNWMELFSRVLVWMGRPIPGKVTYRFHFMVLIHFLNLFQLILGMRSRWKILNARFQSIEDLIVIIFLCVLVFEMGWSPNKLLSMKTIVQQELYVKKYPLKVQEDAIIVDTKKKESHTFSMFLKLCSTYAFLNGIIPYCCGIYLMKDIDVTNNIKQEEIPMPIECWIPITVQHPVTYIILVSPQLLLFLYSMYQGFIWFGIIICSLLHLEKEIDLLCLSIKEIDRLAEYDNQSHDNKLLADDEYKKEEQEKRLRTVFSDIIEHHQKIIRTARNLNEALALILLLLNYVNIAQICAILYAFFETEETASRLKYVFLLIPIFLCLFYFCWYGQQLTNKGEELYHTIGECSWLNKPLWFKKNLQILMLYTSKPLQINLYGLYVLDLKNLVMVNNLNIGMSSSLQLLQFDASNAHKSNCIALLGKCNGERRVRKAVCNIISK